MAKAAAEAVVDEKVTEPVAEEKKEVVEAPSASTAVVPMSVSMDMLMEDEGQGLENVGIADVMVPYLSVLQNTSPQVKKKDAAYVEGAEEGMFYNTASGVLYDGDKGVILVPAHFIRRHVEWIPRDKGGGLVADYGKDSSVLARCEQVGARYVTKDGNEIVVSGTHYVFIVNPETGQFERAIFSLSGTQMKKSRKWINALESLQWPRPNGQGTFKPASFASSFHVTTVPESNKKGDWMGVKIVPFKPTLQLPNGNEIYLKAREFKKSIEAGEIKIAEPEQHSDSGSEDDPPF